MEEKKPILKRITKFTLALLAAVGLSATLGLFIASLVKAFLLGWGVIF